MPDATKILWVNPVGITDYDAPMGELMAGMKASDTAVEVVSLSTSPLPHHLEYRSYEALIVADMVRLARMADEEAYHAMVIGCFYDPGLEDAREISGKTVIVAPCQASVQIAANLANRFSIIIGQEKWAVQMRERVDAYGYAHNLASMRSIDIGVPDLQKDCDKTTACILDAGRKAIEQDKAEALILGCTCSFGMHEVVQERLGVPVIDPILAAFKMAEFLGGLRRRFDWWPSRAWSCAPPPEAELRSFGLFQTPAPVGNRVSF
jgi:allantoin racemase